MRTAKGARIVDPVGAEPVAVEPVRLPHALILVLRGELDLATAPGCAAELTEALDTALRTPPPPPLVVVDLRELRFLSVTGVSLLLRVAGRCADRTVPVCLSVPAEGIVRRVIDLLVVADQLPVFTSPEHAVACRGLITGSVRATNRKHQDALRIRMVARL